MKVTDFKIGGIYRRTSWEENTKIIVMPDCICVYLQEYKDWIFTFHELIANDWIEVSENEKIKKIYQICLSNIKNPIREDHRDTFRYIIEIIKGE